MRLVILDTKKESEATCYLCKVDLATYIKSIPETYKDFAVQRGIVANRYLDHLAETIHKKKHIPPIVLIANTFKKIDAKTLMVSDYQILDGLQRTHRLKVIWDVLEFLKKSDANELCENPGKFSRVNSASLRALGGDAKLVKSLVELGCASLKNSENFFNGSDLWLEVWTDLTESEQVEKMLLLNAGHKSVNIKHQLELLFLSTLFRLENISPKGVQFIREKEISAIQYSKTRKTGQYHFSHVISALIALSAGKVINTNSDFVSDLQSNQNDYVELMEGFNLAFVKRFTRFLFDLDNALLNEYQDLGTKWLGREVVLIGIFAAIGEMAEKELISIDKALAILSDDLSRIAKGLKLRDFELERNNVELNKVNVGNVNKRAVFRAMHDLIRRQKFLGWKVYFGSTS